MTSRLLVSSLAFSLLAALGACGKGSSSKPAAGSASGTATPSGPVDPRVAAIITKSKELRDRACACADGPCAAAVRDDHDRWLKAQIDEYAKLGEPTSTKAQEEEAAKWQKELFGCLDRLPAAAPTAPAAPAPTPGAPAPAAPTTPPAPATP